MIASLPMYDWPELRSAHDAFWGILAGELREAGFDAPTALKQVGEGDLHWLDDDLLFSQTCGYPYATRLSGKVQLLATPCYSVEGCDGPTYSSAIIVRCDAVYETIQDALEGCLTYNSLDSLSGYRCFSPLIGDASTVFGSSRASGSHRTSALMVAAGEADCAAIDAVCWDMVNSFEPEAAQRLRILQWGPQFPALPYITNKGWSADELERLRQAVEQGIAEALSDPACAVLKLAGCKRLESSHYECLKNLDHN